MWTLGSDCVGVQQARGIEAALLTSQKRCIILKQLYPPPERSAPHGKNGCALLGDGEGLNQLKKGGLKSCPFYFWEWGITCFFSSAWSFIITNKAKCHQAFPL